MADFDPDQTDTTTTDAPADDIRSSLVAAFAEHEAAAPDPKPAAEAKTPPTEPTEKAVERARGPDGKFVSPETDGAPAPTEAAAAPAEKPDPAKPAEPQAATGTEAPANWREADKATFKEMPAQAQEFLLRRHREMEADYTRKTQQLAGFQREYEPVHAMFAPHAQEMQQRGLTPASLIQTWYNVERNLMNPQTAAETIARIAQGYKVAPDRLMAALGVRAPAVAAGPGEQPATPQPETAQPQLPPELLQRLSAHEQWIAQEDQRRRFEAQQQRQAHETRVVSEIDQFASATDKAGALLHPHFKDVEGEMARHAEAMRVSGLPIPPLSELYETAVWANPSTRTRLLAGERAAQDAQRKADDDKRKEEARAKAERSRRAGSSVAGSPGGNSQTTPQRQGDRSIRQELAAAMEDLEA